ncbi:hypothetical protein IWW54_002055 [Coemansia sp. RSA 2705]|nr:hypothetical protein IWW54_002055 [Coemansia sp. RSA 2705]
MPKKFAEKNSKAVAAAKIKAEAKAEKDERARQLKEQKESQAWSTGAKKAGKKEDQEAKRLEKLARKAKADKLLAAENSGIAKSKPRTGGPSKLAPKVKPPPPVVRGAEKKAVAKEQAQAAAELQSQPVQAFQARNIDDAILLMDAVAIDDDAEGSTPSAARKPAQIDRHPERRFKAAFEAYKDTHFDRIKSENPGLRRQQIHDMLYKQFAKAPENPFNQVHAAHNATQDAIDKIVMSEKQKLESRLQM